MELASVDGVLSPREEARIPISDEGLLRGDGAFEVIRLYAGRPYAHEEHLARLARSCEGIRLPVDIGRVRAEAAALLAAAGPVDAMLRIVLTRGGRRVLTTETLPVHAPSVALATVTYAPGRVLDGLKTLSYGANMLAGRLARERGADEALLVTPHGRVLEAPTSSLFVVRDGVLTTPPLSDHILASITRDRIVEACGAREAVCTLEDLAQAEELFLASTVREVQPISAVDGRPVPLVPGPVTTAAAERYTQLVADELAATAA
jgi:branched-chain amino acid aminotransferase